MKFIKRYFALLLTINLDQLYLLMIFMLILIKLISFLFCSELNLNSNSPNSKNSLTLHLNSKIKWKRSQELIMRCKNILVSNSIQNTLNL